MSATDGPPDPLADADGVRGVIATDLSDSEINQFLDDAAFQNWRVNDLDAMGDPTRQRIEKFLAAHDIRASRDRDFSSASRDSTDLTYDGSALKELRRKVRSLDPSGELVPPPDAATRRSASVGSAKLHGDDGLGADGDPERKRENGRRVPR